MLQGLGLCSMKSTLSELLVAPLARLRLASLVNKHRLFAQHDFALDDSKDLLRQWNLPVIMFLM